MPAFADVPEESLSRVQLCTQSSYLPHPAVDHSCAPLFVTVKDLADLRQAQPHHLTGPDDAQAVKVFLRVVAVPGRSPLRNDDPFILPMSQHVSRDADPCRCLADSHASMFAG